MTTNVITPTHEPGQRQLELPLYLSRILPLWQTPYWLEAERWRRVVANQPFAGVCRDTLIANVLSLRWHVTARDPEMGGDYRREIDYYSKLFLEIDDEGYNVHTEAILKDMYDTPFGGCSEVGRRNDSPDGRVRWVKRMDAATLTPTFNSDWPVVQKLKYAPTRMVPFPRHAITRVYVSPRTEFERKGWGMPPPERIYLAIELLFRGDAYYANLLLDTPEAGILDLMDMSKDAAKTWLDNWRLTLTGTDPFKVPVLYEHDQKAEWISFTRSPVEMMFDRALVNYHGLCAAGYGLSLSDTGIPTAETNTLAGSIRQERRSRRTGVGTAIVKTEEYYCKILPSYLRFELIDRDEELLVAKGRARLANSIALGNLVKNQTITQQVALAQMVADGLITVPVQTLLDSLPSTIPAGGVVTPDQMIRNTLGDPIPASSGGMGEVKSTARSAIDDAFQKLASECEPYRFVRVANVLRKSLGPVLDAGIELDESDAAVWRAEFENFAYEEPSEFDDVIGLRSAAFVDVTEALRDETWWVFQPDQARLKASFVPESADVVTQVRVVIEQAEYVNDTWPRTAFPAIVVPSEQYLDELVGHVVETVNQSTLRLLAQFTMAELTDPEHCASNARSLFLTSLAERAEMTHEYIRTKLKEHHERQTLDSTHWLAQPND